MKKKVNLPIAQKLANLIDVKTVVTFTVVSVFAYLACVGQIEPKEVVSLTAMIVTFFFASRVAK